MSIASVPRRVGEVRPSPRTTSTRKTRVSRRRIRPWLYVAALSFVVLLMVIFVNDRQSSITLLQQKLEDAQSNYVTAIDRYTQASAPERIVTAAGTLQLTVPQSVVIVHEVSLQRPIIPVRFTVSVPTQSRVVVSTNEAVATPAPARP
ncbi:MAG: hypothetical protein KJS64_05680 [Acidobacteria bacterium]|nr:hypothetical protein [Acidobacteriota bacterium]